MKENTGWRSACLVIVQPPCVTSLLTVMLWKMLKHHSACVLCRLKPADHKHVADKKKIPADSVDAGFTSDIPSFL